MWPNVMPYYYCDEEKLFGVTVCPTFIEIIEMAFQYEILMPITCRWSVRNVVSEAHEHQKQRWRNQKQKVRGHSPKAVASQSTLGVKIGMLHSNMHENCGMQIAIKNCKTNYHWFLLLRKGGH